MRCRSEKLATLEFDRERKTMSVICRPATNGVAGGRGARGKGTQLLVKGAAECVLQRCTQVSALLHSADHAALQGAPCGTRAAAA